jgi:methylmalonyl-CoA/ethylmalonyl-CoA epimerase
MKTPRLEHLGIAVEDLEAAEKIYTDLTGAPPYKREEVADENVITSFFETANGAKIELLATTSPDGPIGRHLERRGEGLHHIAFGVDDLEAEMARLEAIGYRRISGPKAGADGKRIAFFHPGDTGKVLVELCADA